MHPRTAAVVAWLAALAPAVLWAEPLSLEQAFARVTAAHPELRLIESRRETLAAERESAALAPASRVGATLENALGTGEASSFDAAELTLSLASRLERGDKRAARTALGRAAHRCAEASESEARRLDLLAEVARRYLAIVAAREQGAIAARDLADRERALDEARSRLRAGAAPESQCLRGRGSRRAGPGSTRARATRRGRCAHASRGAVVRAPSHVLGCVPRSARAAGGSGSRDARSPDRRLARPSRDFREASSASSRRACSSRAARPRSMSSGDVGVRRLEASDDLALVAGLLGAARRQPSGAAGHPRGARRTRVHRDRARGEAASLYATLVEAHERLESASLEVQGSARR